MMRLKAPLRAWILAPTAFYSHLGIWGMGAAGAALASYNLNCQDQKRCAYAEFSTVLT